MDKSREIVFHLARRLLWAKRRLRAIDELEYQHSMRFAIWIATNEAQNCYRDAKMVLNGVEFD